MKKLLWGFFTLVTLPISIIIIAKVWASKQNKKAVPQEENIYTKKINSKEEVGDKDKNSIQSNQTESEAEVRIIKNITEIKPTACDFIVIDIETTGLSSKRHKITEIAAIKVKDGQIIETFQTLIKPYQRPGEDQYQNQEYLSNKITELTGITEDMLSTAPKIESVLKEFQLFISDQLLMGHNISFDLGFLKRDFKLFLNHDLTNSVVDTLVLSRSTLSISNHKLGTLAQYFNVQIEGSHRALADCKTTLEVYKGLLKKQTEPEKKNLTELEIKAQAKKFTASHPLYAKKCVSTSLSTMTLRSVKELLEELGGIAQDNITKSTEILILGSRESTEKPSAKHKKALEYIAKGQAIQILNEFDFFEILLKNDEV